MRKITKLKLASKSTKLRKKNMKEGNLPPVQQLPQKKSLMLLLKQTNPLVLISFGILLLVSVVLVVSLIFLIVLNKNAQRMSTQSGSSNELESGAGLTKINLPTSTPTPMPRPFLAGPHIFSVSSPENIILVKQI